MPRGDGTGPRGMGPMTGRGAGFCAGYTVPGYANPVGGRWSGGGGFGRGGGRGYRNMYYATGLPGWARGGYGYGYPVGSPGWGAWGVPPAASAWGPEQETEALRQQAEALNTQMEAINKRLAELEDKS